MAWVQVAADGFTDTPGGFAHLQTHNPIWTQDEANGIWRISSNGTSAGASVFATARCYLVSAPAADQAAEFTIRGTSLERETGLILRFTDGDSGNFWGGVGYVTYFEAGHILETHRLDGGGSHTQIASVSYTPVDGDQLRVEMIGTRLEVFINGVSQYAVTDATIASGTVSLWAGISIDDTTNTSIDDFAAYQQAVSTLTLGWLPTTQIVRGRRSAAVPSGMTPPQNRLRWAA